MTLARSVAIIIIIVIVIVFQALIILNLKKIWHNRGNDDFL